MTASSLATPADSQAPLRIAVVGGGISGLAAAHRLLELSAARGFPVEVTLFEASDRLGGLIDTRRIGPFIMEAGPDSFITNKPWALDLCRRLGLEDRLIPTDERYRRSLILHRGRTVETPEGFNLLAPARVWPFLKTPLLSWRGKLRMLCDCFLPRRRDAVDESLAEFALRRFGREALERIIQPMVGGIYTSDPRRLSLQATLPRFIELEQKYGSVIRGLRSAPVDEGDSRQASGARYGLFVSLQDGLAELVDSLQTRILQRGNIRLRTRLLRLEVEDHTGTGGIRLHTLTADCSDVTTCDGIILALPAHRTADLLRRSTGVDQELADALDDIPYASSAILVSGHRLADVRHPLDAFGLVIPHVEGRRILAVSFLSRKFRGRAPEDSVILRTFVGGELQPQLLQHDDQQLTRMVLEELRDILGVTGEPLFLQLARYSSAMPQYHVGHSARVQRIETAAKPYHWLQLAGNHSAGVGIPDAVHAGELSAERLLTCRYPQAGVE